MPHLVESLPSDVQHKLAQYRALWGVHTDELLRRLAQVHGWAEVPEEAASVTWLVKHSKLRQFPKVVA